MSSRRSGVELFWLGTLALTIIVIIGLIALCVWGAYWRGYGLFRVYAVIVAVIGAMLLGVVLGKVEDAERRRRFVEITVKRQKEQMMHVENTFYINSAGNVKESVAAVQDAVRMGQEKENIALREEITRLEKEVESWRQRHRSSDTLYNGQIKALEKKCETLQGERNRFSNLYDDLAAMYVEENRKYREKCATEEQARTELSAYRLAETKRKDTERRLLDKVEKARKNTKLRNLESACNTLAAANTALDCNIEPEPFEVTDAIIALHEYLCRFRPGLRLKAYLWDCATVQNLKRDIHDGIVKTAFGAKWEERMLAGLVGLGIFNIRDVPQDR